MVLKKIGCKILDAVLALVDFIFFLWDELVTIITILSVFFLLHLSVRWFLSPFFLTPESLNAGSSIAKIQVQEEERTLEEIILELREKLDGIERR